MSDPETSSCGRWCPRSPTPCWRRASTPSWSRPDANKIEIRQAIEKIFSVTVVKINTLNRKGKMKRTAASPEMGKRPETKRAIVTLAEGQKIPLFES